MWSSMKTTKYFELLMILWGDGPHTSKWIIFKGVKEIKSLLLKDNAGCFPSWHDKQEILYDLIVLNLPIEVRNRSLSVDIWPNRECQSSREVVENWSSRKGRGCDIWWCTKVDDFEHTTNFTAYPKKWH